MSDESRVSATLNEFSSSSKRRFLVFITGSILISAVLVTISMVLYGSSGAAQLDLSRPGYISVRSQADGNKDNFLDYSSTGSIDKNSINDFKTLFNQQVEKIKTIDAFGGDPLSPDALGIGN